MELFCFDNDSNVRDLNSNAQDTNSCERLVIKKLD